MQRSAADRADYPSSMPGTGRWDALFLSGAASATHRWAANPAGLGAATGHAGNFSMQSMSDVMQECKNFSLALDALHTKHSWIFPGAHDITRDDDVHKICNRLRISAWSNRLASSLKQHRRWPRGRSACVQRTAKFAPKPARHRATMAGLSRFFLRLGLLGTPALAADPRHVIAIAAHRLTALTASFARFVAGKFVRIAAGMRGFAAATRQQAALLRIQCGKAAPATGRVLSVFHCASSRCFGYAWVLG